MDLLVVQVPPVINGMDFRGIHQQHTYCFHLVPQFYLQQSYCTSTQLDVFLSEVDIKKDPESGIKARSKKSLDGLA
jgi:hypothetical protein